MSLTKLEIVVDQLDHLLSRNPSPTVEEVRPLVHAISEAYLDFAFSHYNAQLTSPSD